MTAPANPDRTFHPGTFHPPEPFTLNYIEEPVMPTFRGKPACECLVKWLPVYEAELLRRGVIKHNIDIFQLIGNAPASAGVHSKGGAFDIGQLQPEAVKVARQMGADATWSRTTGSFANNRHTHGVLRGCPHNGPARYQIDAVDAGFNGLGAGGRGGRDTGPRPLSGRTWVQGIAWAKAVQREAATVKTVVKVDELSGRFDRSPGLLATQVKESARVADIILLTEVSNDARARAAKAACGPGWTLSRENGTDPDMGEVAILTRDSAWRCKEFNARVLGPDIGPGGKVVAGIALLEHTKTGATFVPSIAHLSSGVEGIWSVKRSRAVKYRSAVDEYRRLHARWRVAYDPDASAAFADWNLNLHRAWVRTWIKKNWPGMTVPRAAVIPKGGTHKGGRLIDWFIRRGWTVDSWRILPAHDASDHRGIRVRGTIRTRKET